MGGSEWDGNESLIFIIGIILLGVGLFLFSNQVSVGMTWYSWRFFVFGSYNLSNGIVSIPLIIGIIMLFFDHKSILAKIFTTLGALFIILTIIMGIQFRFERTSLFVYILIVGLIAAGSGIILKVLFKKRKK